MGYVFVFYHACLMSYPQNPLVIIPARLNSSRLPQKPLHMIAGKTLLAHVIERVKQAFSGTIVVACCHEDIAAIARSMGVSALLTPPELPSGTDRIYHAFLQISKQNDTFYDAIVGLQGDMAIFSPDLIEKTLWLFNFPMVDIATAYCPTMDPAEGNNPHCVKVALEFMPYQMMSSALPQHPEYMSWGRAMFFSRTPPVAPPYLKHIGIYAYRPHALRKFATSPASYLEKQESLEQLRALSLDLNISAVEVTGDFLSIDTPSDAINMERLFV